MPRISKKAELLISKLEALGSEWSEWSEFPFTIADWDARDDLCLRYDDLVEELMEVLPARHPLRSCL